MTRTDDIKKYLIEQFLLDTTVEDLADDYDLLANGVVDSLGLLTLVSWLESEYRLDIDALDIAPENFRTAAAINAFLEQAQAVPDGTR
ncbi:acyl carrier protein [Kitasatospora aureofaciens]|uniref:acyl carrier protein n=1 Tax=Kitasatospora aureofaciens TaxID=1894 RepID=UPI001C46CB66|nr:acyl carrier protein [Kitasatospora aureofaciens]MBV6699354.1 acyl carrier protein [Kitasatospora aureofaciens]